MYIDNNDKIGIPLLAKIIILFTSTILTLITLRFFITPFTVSDDSMSPGLKKGNIIFILKTGSMKIGDIALIKSPVEPDMVLLKRLIAAEGNTIEIRNKIIYIDNKKAHFNWKTLSSDSRIFPMNFTKRDNFPAEKIKRKHYFVLGDNLDNSFDSRSFGPVEEESIIGKYIFKL